MTNKQWGLTVLRVVVGVVFLMHGWQKLFVYHLSGAQGAFAQMGIPMPHVTAVVVTFVEFLGGIALILGLLSRWAAVLLAFDMAGAILFVHVTKGFFMPAGFEYALTLLAATVALALLGPGAASLEEMIFRRK